MKQFDPILQKPEKPEIDVVISVKKRVVKIAELRPYPGQKIWELNLATATITEADFKEEKTVLIPDFNLHSFKKQGLIPKIIRDIDMKEGCLYVAATRAKVADKKFIKMVKNKLK